jgi:hypothetical protein
MKYFLKSFLKVLLYIKMMNPNNIVKLTFTKILLMCIFSNKKSKITFVIINEIVIKTKYLKSKKFMRFILVLVL